MLKQFFCGDRELRSLRDNSDKNVPSDILYADGVPHTEELWVWSEKAKKIYLGFVG